MKKLSIRLAFAMLRFLFDSDYVLLFGMSSEVVAAFGLLRSEWDGSMDKTNFRTSEKAPKK